MSIDGDEEDLGPDPDESGISEVEAEKRRLYRESRSTTGPKVTFDDYASGSEFRKSSAARDSSSFTRRYPSSDKEPEQRSAVVTFNQPIQPKVFRGLPSEDVNEWLDQFEAAASANQWDTDEKKFARIPYALEGSALKWFKNHYDPSRSTRPYRAFTDELKAVFEPIRPQLMYLTKHQERKQQEGESSRSYFFDKTDLMRKAGIDMKSSEAVDLIISGLRPELATKVYSGEDSFPDTRSLWLKLKLLDEKKRYAEERLEDQFINAAEVVSDPPKKPEEHAANVAEQQTWNRQPGHRFYNMPSRGPAFSNERRIHFQDQTPSSQEIPMNSTAPSAPPFPSRSNEGPFQRSYQRPNRPMRRDFPQPQISRRRFSGCYICDDPGHLKPDCPLLRQVQQWKQGNASRGPQQRTVGPSENQRRRLPTPQAQPR